MPKMDNAPFVVEEVKACCWVLDGAPTRFSVRASHDLDSIKFFTKNKPLPMPGDIVRVTMEWGEDE